MKVFNGISRGKLDDILKSIKNCNIALIGDICLDVYWHADMTKSELSRETPHFPLPIVKERMYPGGGGNAAANIAALNPNSIKLLGVAGRDWRGDMLVRKLKEAGVDTDNVVISEKAVTNAYCKPIRKGISQVEYEDPRLDFCNYEKLSSEDEALLLEKLVKCAGDIDVLCVSDQLQYGCVTDVIREKIISLAKEGLKVIVDSRDRIGLYSGVTLKPNELEGTRAVYKDAGPAGMTMEDFINTAKKLAERNKSKVCMTLGPKGCIYIDQQNVIHVPSNEVEPPIDICGAGDTFLSAFSCALAAEAEPWEAASFANMAAEVTVKKVGITGTANPDEIIARHKEIKR